ncbi:protease-associated domain-containing protein [Pectobacterium versatile]|uniref:hypothetical protein n=1 Tax=Pectobacterium versatile TaxID=2488639 RepID=UPI001F3E3A7D|nr:hypothetical protein [Pectobacterium versatile]
MFDYSGFKPDSLNKNGILCWACYRNSPWHLAGIFHTKEDAIKMQSKLGDGYKVKFGTHWKNTTDFVGGDQEPS